MNLSTKFVSSLEKVFCVPDLNALEIESISGARGETVAFQLALKAPNNYEVDIECECDAECEVLMRETGLVPCGLPAVPEDPFILSAIPGLYPDPLLPLQGNSIRLTRGNWHSVWCSIRIPENMKAGDYKLKFRLAIPQHKPHWKWDQTHEPGSCELSFGLHVHSFTLPKQKLITTLWFHPDCIHTRYKVGCWSKEHWELLGNYFRNMAEHGVNTLLTPLWTLPLDTSPTGERPTTQLLEIEYADGVYRFDFSRLEQWIAIAKANGIEYFEMSHAFTQWGAKACPKIVVKENGEYVKKFGWHVAADSAEYRDFMTQLMPKLIPFIQSHGLTPDNTFFHVSDEPQLEHMESYTAASELLRGLIGDYPVIEAASHIEFLHKGIIKRPVPVTNSIAEFQNEPLEQRWVYYCGNWQDNVPNRQFGMPSMRNRVLGVLLYLLKIDGFLNWGYNFWYSHYSLNQNLDPFYETDAGRAFCGGGSFMVYPGANGPVDSLHYEVFREGLQDMRALSLLESRIGREKTVALIQDGVEYPITINNYPHSAEWLLGLRDRINKAIAE